MRFRKTETTPEKPEDSALQRRFERKVRLSWLALLAERIWEALLWPFLVAAVFIVVSLLELWSFMPPLLHRVVLSAFGLALLISFLPLLRIQVPTRLEALRRLERNANIQHRPATSYEDRLGATPPKETVALWAAHRERLSRLIAKLKPSWASPLAWPQAQASARRATAQWRPQAQPHWRPVAPAKRGRISSSGPCGLGAGRPP